MPRLSDTIGRLVGQRQRHVAVDQRERRAVHGDRRAIEQVGQPLVLVHQGLLAGHHRHRDLAELQLGSIICVPTSLVNLRTVIFAARDAKETSFREVDLELMMILSRQATIALENARLYEELAERERRIEKDLARFSSFPGSRPHIDERHDRSMINLDEPDHQAQRVKLRHGQPPRQQHCSQTDRCRHAGAHASVTFRHNAGANV